MKRLTVISSFLQIRTHIHSSLYLTFLLFAGIIASQFPESYPLWQRIVYGIIGSLAFVVLVNLRQFLINLLATTIGIPIKNTTLFIFGGEARVPEADTRPNREFLVAISGLILNLLIAIALQWFSANQSVIRNPISLSLIQWLAFIWYALALLNIIPGFPLEGGKILMVILWKATKSYIKAIRVSTWLGRFVGILSFLGGIANLIFQHEIINSLLLILFGWILYVAATLSYRRASLLETLYRTTASNIMTEEFPPISPQTTLRQIVNEVALITGQHYFTVVENDKLLGVVTIDNIRRIHKNGWDSITAGDIMKPVNKIKVVQIEDTAAHVMELLDQTEIAEIPVMTKDKLVGVAIKDDLVRLADIHSRLKI